MTFIWHVQIQIWQKLSRTKRAYGNIQVPRESLQCLWLAKATRVTKLLHLKVKWKLKPLFSSPQFFFSFSIFIYNISINSTIYFLFFPFYFSAFKNSEKSTSHWCEPPKTSKTLISEVSDFDFFSLQFESHFTNLFIFSCWISSIS